MPRDATAILRLRDAGVIRESPWSATSELNIAQLVLGKANLDEFAAWKSAGPIEVANHTNGWSAVGGQISSAYVEGGYASGGDPGGSSGGSAVGVSAGFAAASLGTDTTGSTVSCVRILLYGDC